MITLTNDQQNILESQSRHLLITGGPGAGKTTVGILKAALEAEGLAEFQQVLFLSFSNSAVYQIKEAARLKIDKDIYKKIEVTTFHSFCFSIIRSFGKLTGIDGAVRIYLPEEVAADTNRLDCNAERMLSHLKESAVKNNQIGFDLFAELAVQIVSSSSQVKKLLQSCYPVIMVDEFQDTDHWQASLLSNLAEGSRTVCFADPNQRIYGFRTGVSKTRIEEHRKTLLPQYVDLKRSNHRSPNNGILDFADCILTGQKAIKPSCIEYESYKYDPHISFKMKALISKMRKNLRTKYGIERPTIAIMTGRARTARMLSKRLNKTTGKIPYPIRHELLVDENEVAYANRVLSILLEGKGQNSKDVVIAILDELSDFYFCKKSIGKAKKLSEWSKKIQEGKNVKAKVYLSLSTIVDNLNCELHGDPYQDANRIVEMLKAKEEKDYLTPLCEILENNHHFQRESQVTKKGQELYAIQGNYEGLKQENLKISAQKRMFDSHLIKSPVTVMNMHKSKGKEYDGVIIFHGENHSMLLKDTESNNENRVLTRVAVTRARHLVTFLHEEGHFPEIIDKDYASQV